MTHRQTFYHRWLCILLLFVSLQQACVSAQRSCFTSSSAVQLDTDCSWTGQDIPSPVAVSGVLQQQRAGPPAIVAGRGPSAGLPHSVQLSYAILDGFQLPDPSGAQGLIPAGLLGAAAPGGQSSLSLRDVRIVVDGPTLQQHVSFFSKLSNVAVYTDGQSFLHVNYYAAAGVSWQSVGLLLADSLGDARSTAATAGLNAAPSNRSSNSISGSRMESSNSTSLRGRLLYAAPSTSTVPAGAAAGNSVRGRPQYNYVLAADNRNLAQHMQRLGAQDTPTPCLLYVDSNVTFSKPPVPAAGIPVARPLVLVGLVGWNASIDFHMQVNQILMNYEWSNISFDSLALENFAPGDAKSAELARPLSVSSANNFWPLYHNRSEERLLIKNCTMTLGGQEELDYYMFWVTVYHSNLPYFKEQAKFIHDTIKISVWKVGWQTDSAIQVIYQVAASCRVIDTTYQLASVVAPRMPRLQQLGPELKLKPAERSQLVTAVGTPQTFKDQLAPLTGAEAGRAHVVLLRSNISMQSLFSSLPDSANSSRNSSGNSSNAASEAAAFVPVGVPLTGIPVTAPLSIVGGLSSDAESEFATTVLDLAFARGLLDVTGESGSKSQLQVQHVGLRGLAQGPGAAAATSLRSPDVWTLLGWAFRRSADDVVLSGCTLELPPPEFARLVQLGQDGGGQVILKLARDVRSSAGDGLVVLTGMMNRPPQLSTPARLDSNSNGRRLLAAPDSSSSLWVESLSAQGLSGSKLLLIPSETAMRMPGGYVWPGGESPSAPSGLSGAALAAAIAVPLVVGIVLIAAAAYVIFRSHRRRQQAGLGKDFAGAMPPGSSLSSSYGASPRKAPDGSSQPVVYAGGQQYSISRADLEQQQPQLGAAGAIMSGRPSTDVAVGRDQVTPSSGSKGSLPTSNSAAGSSSCGPTDTTIDSAQSLSKAPATCAAVSKRSARSTGDALSPQPLVRADSAQQPEQHGLSHRLTSAISHLQQDITRRRIMGTLGSGSGRGQCSSGIGPPSPPEAAAAAAPAGSEVPTGSGPSTGQQSGGSGQAGSDERQKTTHSSCRGGCSLAASRNPAIAASAAAIVGGTAPAELQVLALIGRGSFASVFRAIWRGRCVALKIVQLPACAGGDDELGAQTRERMAVMEAVVSVTMSHPNIVQVYTFALQPLFQGDSAMSASPIARQQQQGPDSSVAGFELQLVMEYCEEGSLRAALNQQRLIDPSSPYRLPAVHLVLALAHDVACAMLHLHTEQIVHADLKASNVLLTKANTFAPFTVASGDTSSDGDHAHPGSCAALLATAQAVAGGRLVAKVADFGLSLALDPGSTHISHMHAGTLTHMSPELLLHARASKASDVYAFGILLWELSTGLRAFQGVPVALVGHNVTQLGLRPPWVQGVSPAIKQLVEVCWAQDPADRPTFGDILVQLEQMLQQSPDQLCRPDSACAAAVLASSQQQQQPQQQQQQQRLAEQLRQGGVAAGQVSRPAAAAAAAATVAGGDAAADVTGDWTM